MVFILSNCSNSENELSQSNDTLSIEEENCIFEGLPIAENFVKPSEFNEIVRILGSIDISHGNLHSEFWENSLQNIAELENLSVLIQPSVPMKLETVPALCLS